MNEHPAIRTKDLTVHYGDTLALHNATLSVPRSAMAAVVGPNGAGKSTLLKGLLQLEPTTGTAEILGMPPGRVRKQVAYVPQRGNVDWTFPITVAETALLGTYPRLGPLRRPRKTDRQTALQALDQVNLTDLANRPIGELSGGQQQRVFLARALAQQAEVILLDEPFVGVDATSETLIVEILRNLTRTGTTILAVHHDLTTAPNYFTHAVLLNRTVIAHGTTQQTLTPDLLAQTYQNTPAPPQPHPRGGTHQRTQRRLSQWT